MKRQRGITLIALVITIIVLLILAGVSISLVVGDNGILVRARVSKERTDEAQVKELQDMDSIADEINNYTNNEPGNQGNENILPAIGISAEECTWEQISAISDAAKGGEYFNLGDTKTFTTTDGKTIVMEIVAFNADEKADGTGTAGITWISKNTIDIAGFDTHWEDSSLRKKLQDNIYESFSSNLQDAIVQVSKTYYSSIANVVVTCEDTLWIPSYREMCGHSTTYETSGADYSSYFDSATARIKVNSNGEATNWWLRTSYRGTTSGNELYVAYSGSIQSVSRSGGKAYGVVLGFCT